MGYDSGSTSHEGCDDDDEDECQEVGGGSRLLGFMFGNVDNSGDLDADYLDEDAKEHLASLVDKLGSSLTDIDLAVRSQQTTSDAAEQDYDEKAEDAVDYEDIDEEYEGPEVQTATEEDFLLSKKDFLSREVSIHTVANSAAVFDDENYDDDDEDLAKKDEEDLEKKDEVMENNTEVSEPTILEDTYQNDVGVLSQEEKAENIILCGDAPEDSLISEVAAVALSDTEEEEQDAPRETFLSNNSTPLPVLYAEDDMVVLRFSEIFGIYEPRKKTDKREHGYPVPKEMYKSLNFSEIIEEDEEAYLKGSLQDVCGVRREVISESRSAFLYEDSKSRRLEGTGQAVPNNDHSTKDSNHCSLSSKVDAGPLFLEDCSEPFYQNFCPVDQLHWEDRIIWSMSSVLSNDITKSGEISGADADTPDSNKVGLQAEPQILMPKSDGDFCDRPILLEPFEIKDLSESILPEPRRLHHPQLLRLESRLDQNEPHNTDSKNDGVLQEMLHSDTIRRFKKLTMQNRDVLEGSWLDNIIWEPQQFVAKPNLILDLEDEQMLFEVTDNNDGYHQWLHAAAMILDSKTMGSNADNLELHLPGGPSAGRFNISNDKFYTSQKSSQQVKSHMKKRNAHGLKVQHSTPALKLQTMKVKLSNKDIANFHRPKALWYPQDNEVVLKEQKKLSVQGPMKIILKSLGGKGCRIHVDADETVLSVKAKASKKLDFKLSETVKIYYSGKELEDDKTLFLQSVRLNSLLHLVRTKICVLPRAQKIPSQNKSLRPPVAFKKKSDLSVRDGHIFLMEYCEERPLLLGNAGMGARLCTYYQKLNPSDQTGSLMRNGNSVLGNVFTLDPADKSPFLGDIKPGSTQSSLETNMYRAPIYQHKVSPVDYLLVRSAKGKLSIRRIDRINVVGQQEPLMEVMAPGSKNVQTYIMNRLSVFMNREFSAAGKGGVRPSMNADELSAQFPSLSEAFLRKRLKHCADLQKGRNGQLLWAMRRNFRIPSEEELRRMVTPENVCAYESMQAGLYRLKQLGISKLTQLTGLLSAMNQLPDEAIALAAASHIERELQITPWNLSINFVACTGQDRGNIERLEITGVGDPSGRGLGFSFVRSIPKAPISNATVKKKTVGSKGSTVTGTDADLRRLSMEAAREVLLKFNVPEEQITKLTRWHRIAVIRKLSSEQAASGVKVDPTTISKYARGQRMSFMQLQQQTREKCQEIWERQLQSLSTEEENESDSEANSDLDSFAGDLENLLDAEEFEDGEDGNNVSKRHSGEGVKGSKTRRRSFESPAEEDIEDEAAEAAEAAELCRMLMDDDGVYRKPKKKTLVIGTGAQMGEQAQSSQLKVGSEAIDRAKKFNAEGNRAFQFDAKEIPARDQNEDESWLVNRNLLGKAQEKKKNDLEQIELRSKKIKILGDGIKIGKEKKSARETFICGACGQLGHMRTNKQCPKYEGTEVEKASGKYTVLDQTEQNLRISSKKLFQIGGNKIAVVDVNDEDKSSSKGKTLKVKCSASEKTPVTSQNLERPINSDSETGNKSLIKINKIKFSNKMKNEDVQVESHGDSIVIKPPIDGAPDRDQSRKKIIIKRPKEIINVDELSQEGSPVSEYRLKTKRIAELSSFQSYGVHERRWLEEEEEKKRQKEERSRRLHEEHTRALEEQERLSEITRFEKANRREREEEEHQKALKKKKEKKIHEIRDDYRKIPERISKRKAVPEMGIYNTGYAPVSKCRRGGEVGLSNILENIVEALKNKQEISYLFLKPVLKKEAPDYLDIIDRPMDLATIRDNARKLKYKNHSEFRQDVWQIAFNAHRYNDGRNPGIPPLADQLLEYCDFLLDQCINELTEAEASIEDGDT